MRRVALLLIAACGDQTAAPSYTEVALIAAPSRDLDVLFVIDDSPGLVDRQIALTNALPALLNEVATVDAPLPNLHIGVVTSDLGTSGYGDAAPAPSIGSGPGSCSGHGKGGQLVTSSAVQGSFILDVADADGSRTANYSGSLLDTTRELLSVGSAGCGFEQPLEAMRIALTDTNTGFVRTNAKLAIIALQDEDDCSVAHSTLFGSDVEALGPLQSFRCTRVGVTCDVGGATPDDMAIVGEKAKCHANEASPYVAPLDRYRQLLETIKSDPRDVIFATIAGDPTPITVEYRTPPGGGTMLPALAHTCENQATNGIEVADPAVRMADLTSRLRRGRFETVCASDYAPTLQSIGRQVRTLLGDTCLPTPLVGDCKVVAETLGDEHEVPYELVPDASCGGGVRLKVSMPTDAGTMLSVRCR